MSGISIDDVKQLVPTMLKRPYRQLKGIVSRLRSDGDVKPQIREIDLGRTLLGGEGTYDAVSWAELTGDWQRASTLLGDSIYVRFLEQYRALGESIFDWKNFEETGYFKNALKCVQFWGDYFGQRTPEGIYEQARTFVKLYQRIKNEDGREVTFPSQKDHARPGTQPVVRETFTPNTFQIADGHHRLAIAWALGHRKAQVTVLRPPLPTGLQSLVLKVNQTQGRKELYQPIDGPEFDSSWGLVRRCHDRLAMMLNFLASRNYSVGKLAVVDLACSYGWFVNEFGKRGYQVTGVERDPTALNIGRIAYGLPREQLVQSDFESFANSCRGTFDVVLLLSVLHYYPLKRAAGTPEDMIRQVDAITGSVLFFDTGQSHEEWWRRSLPEWNDEFIINFIKQNTSFTHVLPLGRDSDNVSPYRDNYARTLFACFRA